VKRIVDLLVDEATEEAMEHRYALDSLRDEVARLAYENRTLRAQLDGLRTANHGPVDNG
jgi:hypothetical protein